MTRRATVVAVLVAALAVLVVGSGGAAGAGIPAEPVGDAGAPSVSHGSITAHGAQTQQPECTDDTAEIFADEIVTGPIRPAVGEEVYTEVNLTNFGQEAGEYTLTFYIDGEPQDSRTLFLEACGEATTTFYYSFDSPGNRTVGITDARFLHEHAVQPAEGEPDGITTEPVVLDLGNVTIGETATGTVTLTNEGNETVDGITPVLPDGEAGTRYTVLTEGTRTLSPGESWNVRVRFRPAEPGQSTTPLRFRDGSGVQVARTRLVGTGVGPDLTVDPGTLTFAGVGVGDRAERTLTVSNTGSESVTVDGLRLLGGSGDFTVETPAGFTLAPDERREVTVAFEPTSQGAQSASLQVLPAADAVASELVWLSTGTATATVDLGQSADRTWVTVAVQNATAGQPVAVPVPERAGDSEASIRALGVTPAVDGNFTLTATDSDDPLPSSPSFRLGDGTTPLDYLSIDHSIANAALEDASLTVRVSRDRLAALNTTATNVSLYRYDGTDWVQQPTRVREVTEAYAVVEATGDGLSEWTAAAKKPRFNISDTSTDLEAGAVGEEVRIQVFVSNTGGATGVYVAKLLLNDAVVDRREATIPDGGKRALNFERSFDDPGRYEVRVNDVYIGTVNISGVDGDVDVGTDESGDGGSGDGSDGGAGGDGGDAGTASDDGASGGGLPPTPALILIGGAILLVAAYVRQSGRPPGGVPGTPPERPQQGGPEGPPQGGPGQAPGGQGPAPGGQQGQQPGAQQGPAPDEQPSRGSGGQQGGRSPADGGEGGDGGDGRQ